MARWIFIRHGQSEANRDGWYAGSVDAPLTPHGRTQARFARADLADEAIGQAVCSDLQRAHQTALILLEGHRTPLSVDAALRERCAGAWERRTLADVRATQDTDATLVAWHGRPPGGESLYEVALRAVGFLATLPGIETTLVVSHGALMRAVIGALDEIAPERIGHWHPDNCAVVIRQIAEGQWGRVHARLKTDAGPRRDR